uniref:Plasminogen activator sPA n=1 Tax=Hirondellea gigas TaxID=1518452 RepID=A0A2P2I3I3_9CRUS
MLVGTGIYPLLVLVAVSGCAGRPERADDHSPLLPGDELSHAGLEPGERQPRSSLLASFEFDDLLPNTRFSHNICGMRRSSVPDIFTRIVGGTVAQKHEFPWQVSMQWRYNWYSYHVCGASILNARWVVTAAHCTHQYNAKDLIVVAGLHNVKHRDGNEQKREVDRVVEHSGYNIATQEHDISLLRVKTNFVIDGLMVSPVCLPAPGQTFRSSGNCIVSGWGRMTEHGSNSDELRKVVVPIITKRKCKESYRVIGYNGPISEAMLCAGYNQGSRDACQGDSGGPFVCRGNDNRYLLVGIVSWGVGCARPNVPGVYTEVSRYIGWLHRVVHSHTAFVSHRAATDQTSLHIDDMFNVTTGNLSFDNQSPSYDAGSQNSNGQQTVTEERLRPSTLPIEITNGQQIPYILREERMDGSVIEDSLEDDYTLPGQYSEPTLFGTPDVIADTEHNMEDELSIENDNHMNINSQLEAWYPDEDAIRWRGPDPAKSGSAEAERIDFNNTNSMDE